MSDYISTNEIYYGRNDIAYERHFGQICQNIEEIGNSALEKVLDQQEEEDSFKPEGSMLTKRDVQSKGQIDTEYVDYNFEKEIERLSSSLITLVRNARQESLQAKLINEHHQRPIHKRNRRSQRCSDDLLSVEHPNRQLMTCPRSSMDIDIAECAGVWPKLGNNIPTGINGTMSASSDLLCLQRDRKDGTKNSLEMAMDDTQIGRDQQKKHDLNKRSATASFPGIQLKDVNGKKWRSYLSDRISALGKLLPDDTVGNNRTPRRKRALKIYIDNMEKLNQEMDFVKELEDQLREVASDIKKLALRLERLEVCMNTKIAKCSTTDETETVFENQRISTSLRESPYPCQRQRTIYADPAECTPYSTCLTSDDIWDRILPSL